MRPKTLVRTRLQHIRNARLPRATFERNQLAKFRRLVAYAAERSPYYRDVIEAQCIEVRACWPQDFPVLTKTDVIRHFDRIVTNRTITRDAIADFLSRSKDPFDLFGDRYYVVHTSGSSGELGYFVYSEEDWTRGVTGALRINPPALRRRRLAFFGATLGHFTGVSLAVTCRRPWLRWLYDVATFEVNRPLAPTIAGLNAFQPDILMGYASSIAILAEQQLRGHLGISPSYIQSSGEPIQSSDRKLVERVFGVPLINVYSCTEHLIMGVGRPDFGGMYLFEDDLYFELASDHTLITNLFNYTMPLIRYRMDDVLMPADDSDGPLPFTKVKDVVGRSEHTPVFTNEHGENDFLSPHVINEFFVKNVRRFQLELTDSTRCLFRVCLEPDLEEAARERTLEDVRARFGEVLAAKDMRNAHFDVQEVPDIPTDSMTGKFRLIVPATSRPYPWAG